MHFVQVEHHQDWARVLELGSILPQDSKNIAVAFTGHRIDHPNHVTLVTTTFVGDALAEELVRTETLSETSPLVFPDDRDDHRSSKTCGSNPAARMAPKPM